MSFGCWAGHLVYCPGLDTLFTVLGWTPCLVSWAGHLVYCPGLDTLFTVLGWTPCLVSWAGHLVYCPGLDTLFTVLGWTHCFLSWAGHLVYCPIHWLLEHVCRSSLHLSQIVFLYANTWDRRIWLTSMSARPTFGKYVVQLYVRELKVFMSNLKENK